MLAAVLMGVAWAIVVSDGEEPPMTTDPVEFPIPDADVTKVTVAYLAASGEAISLFHNATQEVAGMRGGGKCGTVAAALDAAVSPRQVLTAIAGVPDPVLREVLTAEHTVVLGVLRSCAGPDAAALNELVVESVLLRTAALHRMSQLAAAA